MAEAMQQVSMANTMFLQFLPNQQLFTEELVGSSNFENLTGVGANLRKDLTRT